VTPSHCPITHTSQLFSTVDDVISDVEVIPVAAAGNAMANDCFVCAQSSELSHSALNFDILRTGVATATEKQC